MCSTGGASLSAEAFIDRTMYEELGFGPRSVVRIGWAMHDNIPCRVLTYFLGCYPAHLVGLFPTGILALNGQLVLYSRA
jgi:hypothetical protein